MGGMNVYNKFSSIQDEMKANLKSSLKVIRYSITSTNMIHFQFSLP